MYKILPEILLQFQVTQVKVHSCLRKLVVSYNHSANSIFDEYSSTYSATIIQTCVAMFPFSENQFYGVHPYVAQEAEL